jgi:predicted ATP-dependent serine protease
MTNNIKTTDDLSMEMLQKEIEEAKNINRIKNENNTKKALLDNKRLTLELENVQKNEQNMVRIKSTKYGSLSKDQVSKLQKDNREYIEAAKKATIFINPGFDGIVPFFRKNLILIGAKTGEGKSTAVANIAYSLLSSRNASGKVCRVLVITNEERAEDFYNRVTCLIKGWHYTNHNKFSEEQIDIFEKMISTLADSGRLTVIDDAYNNSHGVTTTIEGIENVFESLMANEEWYDAIIIDYYQNVMASQNDPRLGEYDVQAKFSRMLDTKTYILLQ